VENVYEVFPSSVVPPLGVKLVQLSTFLPTWSSSPAFHLIHLLYPPVVPPEGVNQRWIRWVRTGGLAGQAGKVGTGLAGELGTPYASLSSFLVPACPPGPVQT
jgi:hypothetical protein